MSQFSTSITLTTLTVDKIKGKGIGNTHTRKTIRVSLQETTPIKLPPNLTGDPMASSSFRCASQKSTKARKLVQSAIVTVLDKQEFLTSATHAISVQNLGKHLLQLPENSSTFNHFCGYLVRMLRKRVQTVGKFRSSDTKREHLWRAFHKLSVEELSSKWKELYSTLSVLDLAENLFHQTVNLVVYEQPLKVRTLCCWTTSKWHRWSTIVKGWVKCSSLCKWICSNETSQEVRKKGRERKKKDGKKDRPIWDVFGEHGCR